METNILTKLVAENTYLCSMLIAFVFFFQAEDGIRDLTVTGVQTCALPICVQRAASLPTAVDGRLLVDPVVLLREELGVDDGHRPFELRDALRPTLGGFEEIGRASCRERV